MASNEPKKLCSSAVSLLLLLLRLGCIVLPTATVPAARPLQGKTSRRKKKKKRKIAPLISPARSTTSAFSVTGSLQDKPQPSFFERFFCCFSGPPSPPLAPPPVEVREELKKMPSSRLAEELPRMASVKRSSSASREDVFPCSSQCEEILTELAEEDSSLNIVRIIFKSGWGAGGGAPSVHRVLKIHGSPGTLVKFEKCRDSVRSRAADRWAAGGGDGADERCMADGNERLRFYGTTFLCGLPGAANPSVCDEPCCAACYIVRRGFADKGEDGVVTHGTGRAAHAALPEELAGMGLRRAMLLCRVVAGRVAGGEADLAGGCRTVYDSAALSVVGSPPEDGLLVFDPRAVLPCFVIVYSV